MVPFNALRKMNSQNSKNQRQAQQVRNPSTLQPNQQIEVSTSSQRNQVHQINDLLNMQHQVQNQSTGQQNPQLDNLLDARNEADALILNDIFMRAEQSNEPNRQEPVYPTQEIMEDFLMEELFGNFDFHQHGLRNFLMDELIVSDGFSQEFNSPQNNHQQHVGQPVEVSGLVEAAMPNRNPGQRVDKVPDDPQNNKQNQVPLPPASAGPSSATCHPVSNVNLCYCSECREVKQHEARGMCKSCHDDLHPQNKPNKNNQPAFKCKDQKVNFSKKPIVECTGCGELKSLYLRNMCQYCYRRSKSQAKKQIQSSCKKSRVGVTKKCKNCCKTNRRPVNPNQTYFWECEQCRLWKQIYANNMCKLCYIQFLHDNKSAQSSSSNAKKCMRCKKCLKTSCKDICDECRPFVKKLQEEAEKLTNTPVQSSSQLSLPASSQLSRPTSNQLNRPVSSQLSQPTSSQLSRPVSRQMPILSVQPATPPPLTQAPGQVPNQIDCPSQVPVQSANSSIPSQAPSQMPNQIICPSQAPSQMSNQINGPIQMPVQPANSSVPSQAANYAQNQELNRYVGRPLSYAANPTNQFPMPNQYSGMYPMSTMNQIPNHLAMHPFYQRFQHLPPCTQCSPFHRCPNTFLMNYLANRAFFSNIFGDAFKRKQSCLTTYLII